MFCDCVWGEGEKSNNVEIGWCARVCLCSEVNVSVDGEKGWERGSVSVCTVER